MSDYLYKKETDGIIAAFYEVYNTLGYGFLERVYQNALYLEASSSLSYTIKPQNSDKEIKIFNENPFFYQKYQFFFANFHLFGLF